MWQTKSRLFSTPWWSECKRLGLKKEKVVHENKERARQKTSRLVPCQNSRQQWWELRL